ncbi:uncharacterized protein [Nothobranchius furzeri]|uniref:uncharacterized protein isoform X2 n=1 Tax=Nothobranchius furzeri TaxID=105023 RepID=UPI003904DA9B
MESSSPLTTPGGFDSNHPTCGETHCSGHGSCVAPLGGGFSLVCDCHLGYQGKSCEGTVNGAMSLPLTISVLAVIIGLLIFAFVFAKFRQKHKKKKRPPPVCSTVMQ